MDEQLYKSLISSSRELEKMSNTLSNINSQFQSLNAVCKDLSNSISGFSISDIFSGIGDITSFISSFSEIEKGFDRIHKILGILGSKASEVFPGIASLIGSINIGPLTAVTVGITGITAVLGYFDYAIHESSRKTDEYVEKLNKKRDALKENTDELKRNSDAAITNASAIQTDYSMTISQVDRLVALTGKDGYVGNIAEAKYLAEQINEVLPGSVEITKDNKVAWNESTTAIKENLEAMERRALVQAYEKDYTEALKNQSKYERELTEAKKAQSAAQEKVNEAQKIYDEYYEEHGFVPVEYAENLRNANKELTAQNEVLSAAESQFAQNEKAINLYKDAYAALDGNIQASAMLQVEMYTEMGQKGTSTWASLAAAREDCKERMNVAEGEELETLKLSQELINAELINKANVFGKTYDEIVQKLKDSGVVMTENEEKELKKSYDRWKMSSEQINNAQAVGLDTLALMKNIALTKMGEDDKNQLAENVKLFAQAGEDEGLELCQQLSESIANNNGKVTDEAQGIIDKINTMAENADAEIDIKTNEPLPSALKNIVTNVQEGLKGGASVPVGLKKVSKGIEILGKIFSLNILASGGFPDTGELFIAREAGPEMVGRIHGKTAVANNDQIVSGISSGVYNAVVGAMSQFGSKNTTVTAIFEVDGKQVAKKVIEAHNREVMQTGRSPLLI